MENKILPLRVSLTSHFISPIKYRINSIFRKKVLPKKGCIIYNEFNLLGICISENEILTTQAGKTFKDEDNKVKLVSLEEFFKLSNFSENIYISANVNGVIENLEIAKNSKKYINEENKYGLIFENSYKLVKKCIEFSGKEYFEENEIYEKEYLTDISKMKIDAKVKINATKWLLLDTNKINELSEDFNFDKKNKNNFFRVEEEIEKISEKLENDIEIKKINETLKKYEEIPLTEDVMKHLRIEYIELIEYIKEIGDENIPTEIVKMLFNIKENLEAIILEYEKNENAIKGIGGDFSYEDLKEMGEEFKNLISEMLNNENIKIVLKKLGRGQLEISENKKNNKTSKINKGEVFGIYKSNDLFRILPSELVNLENENLKYLFYSKYLENNFLTYEIEGKNDDKENELDIQKSEKGPIIVCLDTSGSMKGKPIKKAKALVLAISKILREENRKMYIILYGSKGQIQEISIESKEETVKIINFLKKSYESGTDFETPLKKSFEIISKLEKYEKSDILMVTDGICKISYKFKKIVKEEKEKLNCKIYTIICDGDRIERDFSDGVLII